MPDTEKKTYIALLGWDKFECLTLILWSLIRRVKILVITPPDFTSYVSLLKHMFFSKRYIKESIKEYKTALGNYKGLWYKVNEETIDSTLRFYNRHLSYKSNLISYYNRILNTNKFEAYIKKKISYQIFALLKDLHLVRLSKIKENRILIYKNPINEFVIKYMEERYKVKYRTKWVYSAWKPLLLFVYYGWLVKQFICRGVIFNKDRKKYKISKEASWGFYQPTLRDDMLIDDERFKKGDILMLNFDTKHPLHIRAFEEAKRRGFDIASVPKLKININRNIFNILFFYFWVPIKVYFQLLLSIQLYFFYYIFMFHKSAFPIELFMNLYHIKCHISTKDWGDIEETIILNKYGAKNVIFHWSDLTIFKAYSLAFAAHNIYFVWGDIHYDYHSINHFIDEKVNIGCIFKKEYNKAFGNKENIMAREPKLKKRTKTVTFFDNSIDNEGCFPVRLYLMYLEIIREFCRKNKDINVLLKAKSGEKYMLKQMKNNLEHLDQYEKIRAGLFNCDNFKYLSPLKWSMEDAIAVSDICVTMLVRSPSTVALICGKNALYYDDTGNIYHPFAVNHRNTIVFEDKNLLFEQINKILNREFDCRDIISEKEIRDYDAFIDDNSFERIRDNLHELTEDSV